MTDCKCGVCESYTECMCYECKVAGCIRRFHCEAIYDDDLNGVGIGEANNESDT